MGETVKKSTKKPKTATSKTTPAKPRKKAAATNGTAAANGTNGHVTEIRISHEQVAMLAHKFWMERGYQHGHHEEDWHRAEQELLGKAS